MMRWKVTMMKKRGNIISVFEFPVVNSIYFFSDAVVNQVLDELGLQLTDTLSGLPQTGSSLPASGQKQPAAAAATATGGNDGGGGGLSDADADLQARLDNLRRE